MSQFERRLVSVSSLSGALSVWGGGWDAVEGGGGGEGRCVGGRRLPLKNGPLSRTRRHNGICKVNTSGSSTSKRLARSVEAISPKW